MGGPAHEGEEGRCANFSNGEVVAGAFSNDDFDDVVREVEVGELF